MLDQINSVFVATRNFSNKKLRVFNFRKSNEGTYLSYWSPAYEYIEKLFGVTDRDLIIVIMCQSVEIPGLASGVQKFISQFDYDRVFIFMEEIVALYHKIEDYPLGKSSLHPIPAVDMIHCREYDFIKKLLKHLDRSKVEIFHCEYNIETMADSQRISPVRYFDWCIVDQILDIYQALAEDPNKAPILSDDEFSKKISCFNYRYSDDRYYISCILSLYDDIDLSQYYRIPDQTLSNNYLSVDKFEDLVKEKIFQGNKFLLSKDNQESYPSTPDEPRPILSVLSYESTRDLIARINDSFLHLVTETRYTTPFANFSEKTLRCLYAGRPFVLLAAPGTLDLLRKLGIKTFSDYWDESYDSIEDPVLRFEKVVSIIEDILNKDNKELKGMLISMKPLLEHNQHMFDKLPETMKRFSSSGGEN